MLNSGNNQDQNSRLELETPVVCVHSDREWIGTQQSNRWRLFFKFKEISLDTLIKKTKGNP